jgi:hypothetical protein
MMLLVASDGGVRIITDFVREGGLIAHALLGKEIGIGCR